MTKTILIDGKQITLYRVRGFVFESWCSDADQVDQIEDRRAREFTMLKQSGSEDVRRTLGELEVNE